MNHDAYYGSLAEEYWELMLAPSIHKAYCVVCGRSGHLEQHHIVWRSWGELHDMHGRTLKKPTVTLCGCGNASGCHGAAHDKRLLFRWVETPVAKDFKMNKRKEKLYGVLTGGHLEFLLLTVPLKEYLKNPNATYADALLLDGWRRCL